MKVLPTKTRADGLVEPVDVEVALEGQALAVPVPPDIGAIRRQDRSLSMHWRMYMRRVLETAFSADYTIVDCLPAADCGWRYIVVHGHSNG
jgi:predicted GNAT superfamily acetyltransferase